MATTSPNPLSSGDVFQNSAYAGMYIENVLFGVELVLYFETMRVLLAHGGVSKRSNIFYAFFSTMMVFFATVWISTQAFFCQKMWILDAGFPGGPNAYWRANVSVWYMDWATTAIIVLQLMTDGLMIYRCYVIWKCNRVIFPPIVLWLASLILGFFADWTSSSPGGDFFTGPASLFALAYCTVSVVLHTMLTSMICYRLVQHGRAVQAYLGREHATLYFSAVTIIVESVFPYTVSGIAYLVSTGTKSPTSVAFVCVYFMMMCISPQMLILRVITGRASDRGTGTARPTPDSTVKFDVEATQVFDSSEGSGSGAVHQETLTDIVYISDVSDSKV